MEPRLAFDFELFSLTLTVLPIVIVPAP